MEKVIHKRFKAVRKHQVIYPALCLFMSFAVPASAQWYNDGASTNTGGLMSDWNGQGINTSGSTYATTGSTGTPSNYGVFEHYGQSGNNASAALINNGSYDASTNGRDYFFGPSGAAGQQEISGSTAPIFGELFVENGAGQVFNISNTNGIDIATAATFQNGITTTVRSNTSTGAIHFHNNATYTFSGLGNTQHVNGYVSKIGNNAFTFPVGSGTELRTLAITAPTNAANISVAWFAGDPNTVTDPSDGSTHLRTSRGSGLNAISPAGFWDWVPVTGATNALTVTVSMPDMTGFALAASLRLVGWNGTQWVDLSGGATATGNTLNSSLSGTVPAGTNITALGIGSNLFPLPVYIESFIAQADGCSTHLSWNTGVEQGIASYDVEYSTDGSSFYKLGNVRPDGSRKYSFLHNQPVEGINYYRLRIIKVDNNTEISKTVTVNIGCSLPSSISVYPNPVTSDVWISGLPETGTIRLLNIEGQILKEITVNNKTEILSLSQFPPATYVLQVLSTGKVYNSFKIKKQ